MDLDFTEEHEMLREMARGVCEQYSPLETVRALEDDERGIAVDLWKQLGELGLIGILIPEAYGGQGQTLLEAAILYEEMGRVLAPCPHFVSAVLAAKALEEAGSAAQKEEWLARIAEGEALLTPAWLEPKRGYGPKGVAMEAVASGDGFVLNGCKLHVAFAKHADRLLVLARTGPDDRDIDLFLVDPDSAGVSVSQRFNLGSETQYRVDFDGVRVSAEDRIGAPRSGAATWDRVMHDGIVLLAAQAAGGAARALEMTVAYAQEREQFGKPLGAFQSISHYLADAATAIEGGKILVYEAAWTRSVGKESRRLAPLAKLFMCQTFCETTATCQQIWGGVGFTIEYDIQLFFRRAKQLQMSWWDERHLEDLIATDALGI